MTNGYLKLNMPQTELLLLLLNLPHLWPALLLLMAVPSFTVIRTKKKKAVIFGYSQSLISHISHIQAIKNNCRFDLPNIFRTLPLSHLYCYSPGLNHYHFLLKLLQNPLCSSMFLFLSHYSLFLTKQPE